MKARESHAGYANPPAGCKVLFRDGEYNEDLRTFHTCMPGKHKKTKKK